MWVVDKVLDKIFDGITDKYLAKKKKEKLRFKIQGFEKHLLEAKGNTKEYNDVSPFLISGKPYKEVLKVCINPDNYKISDTINSLLENYKSDGTYKVNRNNIDFLTDVITDFYKEIKSFFEDNIRNMQDLLKALKVHSEEDLNNSEVNNIQNYVELTNAILKSISELEESYNKVIENFNQEELNKKIDDFDTDIRFLNTKKPSVENAQRFYVKYKHTRDASDSEKAAIEYYEVVNHNSISNEEAIEYLNRSKNLIEETMELHEIDFKKLTDATRLKIRTMELLGQEISNEVMIYVEYCQYLLCTEIFLTRVLARIYEQLSYITSKKEYYLKKAIEILDGSKNIEEKFHLVSIGSIDVSGNELELFAGAELREKNYHILLDLARVYENLYRVTNANEDANRAKEIYGKINIGELNLEDQYICLHNIARLSEAVDTSFADRERLEESISYYAKAEMVLDTFRDASDTSKFRAELYNNQAGIYLKKLSYCYSENDNNIEKIEEIFRQAEDKFEESLYEYNQLDSTGCSFNNEVLRIKTSLAKLYNLAYHLLNKEEYFEKSNELLEDLISKRTKARDIKGYIHILTTKCSLLYDYLSVNKIISREMEKWLNRCQREITHGTNVGQAETDLFKFNYVRLKIEYIKYSKNISDLDELYQIISSVSIPSLQDARESIKQKIIKVVVCDFYEDLSFDEMKDILYVFLKFEDSLNVTDIVFILCHFLCQLQLKLDNRDEAWELYKILEAKPNLDINEKSELKKLSEDFKVN